MSSSDNDSQADKTALGWDAFEERDVRVDVALVSPAAEAASLLQSIGPMMLECEQQITEARNADLRSLSRQAVLVVQLASALKFHEPEFEKRSLQKIHRQLRVIKDQMLETIEQAGLEVVVPLGEGFDNIADDVHVAGWRHDAAFESEQVIEVVEPIVRHKGRLIHMGRVVMGAPPSDSDQGPVDVDRPGSPERSARSSQDSP